MVAHVPGSCPARRSGAGERTDASGQFGGAGCARCGPPGWLTGICRPRHTYDVSVGTTIEVIAEPSRRRILDELRKGEQPVGALVECLELSQPTVSKHLRVLREAQLVEVRPEGQRRLYRVRPEALLDLDAWLEPYRAMWRHSLDRLEAQVGGSGRGGGRDG